MNFPSSEQALHLSWALLLNTLPCIYSPAWLPYLLDGELPEVKVSPRGAWHGSSTWGDPLRELLPPEWRTVKHALLRRCYPVSEFLVLTHLSLSTSVSIPDVASSSYVWSAVSLLLRYYSVRFV